MIAQENKIIESYVKIFIHLTDLNLFKFAYEKKVPCYYNMYAESFWRRGKMEKITQLKILARLFRV